MSKFPKGDRLNATYRHEFYQEARTSPFVGYSKMIGHPEAKDKEHLLEQYVSRMLKNGYLERSYCMNFYTNNHQGNDQDDLLVSITSQGFTLHDRTQLFPHLRDLLTRYFANKGNPDKQFAVVSNRKHSGSQVESMYDFKKKFQSREELTEHCKKVKEKFGEGQHERLKGFYFKMIEINNL